MKKSKLLALLGAAVLMLGMAGTAFAAATGPSDQGVVPSFDGDNITLDGNGGSDKAACENIGTEEEPEWDGIETGNTGGTGTSPSGVEVTWTYDSTTKEFGFTADGGLVSHAYVKGSSGYNHYDYTGKAGGGVASDGGMYAPDNGSEGPAGLSHAVFCVVEGEEETAPPSFEETAPPSFGQTFLGETDVPTEPSTDSIGTNGTASPADGAWLLVVALGVLLASIVVLTPARARSRR